MSNELQKTEEQVPSFLSNIEGAPTTWENADANDVLTPRIVLCQAMSPVVQEGKAKAGDLIWSDTQEIIVPAGEPLRFIPVHFQKEYLHFGPRSQGGGLIDRSFDPNGEIARKARQQIRARMQDTFDANREDSYIESYNFAVWLPDLNRPGIIACARSNIKHAKQLNALIYARRLPDGRRAPVYAGVYEVFSEQEVRRNYRYWVFKFRNAGWVDSPELFEQLRRTHEELSATALATAPDTSEVMDKTPITDLEAEAPF